jgi:hypothetical protein
MVALIDKAMECDPVVERSPRCKREIEVASFPYLEIQKQLQKTAKQITITRIFQPKPRLGQLQPASITVFRRFSLSSQPYYYYNIIIITNIYTSHTVHYYLLFFVYVIVYLSLHSLFFCHAINVTTIFQ